MPDIDASGSVTTTRRGRAELATATVPTMDLAVLGLHDESPSTVIKMCLRRGWNFVHLSEVIAALDGRGSLPANPVLLTYDDGRSAVWSLAHGVVQTYGIKANVFLSSDFVSGNLANVHPNLAALAPGMTWANCEAMAATGLWEFGNHGQTHNSFDSLTQTALETEIGNCNAAILANLGQVSDTVAYPFGTFPRGKLSALKGNGIKLAWTYQTANLFQGSRLHGDHPLLLSRADGSGTDKLHYLLSETVLYHWGFDHTGERNAANVLGYWTMTAGTKYGTHKDMLQIEGATNALEKSIVSTDYFRVPPASGFYMKAIAGTIAQTAGTVTIGLHQYDGDLNPLADIVCATYTTTTEAAGFQVRRPFHADCRFVKIFLKATSNFDGRLDAKWLDAKIDR